jgi:D-alanyl-lipoteichoic acid acyltransferase DltB (MBOAT superfamily)
MFWVDCEIGYSCSLIIENWSLNCPMLFNSLSFAFFLPLVFGLYWWLGGKKQGRQKQNIFLLLASYLFYGWWDPRFLILIFISSLGDYLLAGAMPSRKSARGRKLLLVASLVLNLGMLGFFKYFNFFAASLAEAFASLGLTLDVPTLRIILPVGISFYTFQTLSYTIDVYRGKIEPSRNPVAFFTFVAFFPQLVAGPIEKARNLLPQFMVPRSFSYPQAVSGLRLILYGILKKVLIADRLADYVNHVYDSPGDNPGVNAFLGTLFFVIQVYCDFSGYSDIAIGTGRLFGFSLSTNFRTPLFSLSISEFWQRWHISLNDWFRDYVYVPLGGRKKGNAFGYFNVMVVFLVSGFWHGAAWHYIFWGLLSGALFVAEGFIRRAIKGKGGILKIGGWVTTISYVMLTFPFFRAKNVAEGWAIVRSFADVLSAPLTLFVEANSGLNAFLSDKWEGLFLALLLPLFMGMELLIGKGSLDDVLDRWPGAARWGFYYVAIALLLLFGAYGVPQQFIYFQF